MGDRTYTLPYNSGTEAHVSENLSIFQSEIEDLIFKVKDLEKVIDISDSAMKAKDRLATKQENAIEEQIKEGKDNAAALIESFEECVRQIIYRVLNERLIAIIPGEGDSIDASAEDREYRDPDSGEIISAEEFFAL